jgi:hypothetical protein
VRCHLCTAQLETLKHGGIQKQKSKFFRKLYFFCTLVLSKGEGSLDNGLFRQS